MAGLERRLCGLWLVLRYPGQPRHSTLSVKLTRGRLSNDIPLPAHIIKSDGTTVETNRSLPLRNNLHESNQHTAALSSTGLLSCTYLYLCSCAFYQLLNTISLNSNVCMNLRQITTATKPSTTSTTPWLISQSALLAPSNPARRIGKRIQSDFNSFLSLTADIRRATLLTVCGPSTYGLVRDLLAPAAPTEKTFEELVALVQEHQQPTPSPIVERYTLFTRVQHSGETINDYVAQLRKIAKHCQFGETLNDMLRDHIVCGCRDKKLQYIWLTLHSPLTALWLLQRPLN